LTEPVVFYRMVPREPVNTLSRQGSELWYDKERVTSRYSGAYVITPARS